MRIPILVTTMIATVLLVFVAAAANSDESRRNLKVPGGLSFEEFKGYEAWQIISISHNGDLMAVIVGNPKMIDAYKAGVPSNGKTFPDGAKMAKIHWNAKKALAAPGTPFVAGDLHDIDFMVKDAKRFGGSDGWGYAAFEYDTAKAIFRPANATDSPPQGSDAKCGAACHNAAKQRDFVFTEYPKR